MTTMAILALLAVNALVTVLCFVLLWLVSLVIKDVSFVDSWWALGLVLIAWVSFMNASPDSPHAGILIALCTIWGLRLGLFLLWRWLKQGADRRYRAIIGKAQSRGWSFASASFFLVFALQAPLQFIISLPVQLGQTTANIDPGPLAFIGMALALFGITFESIGDAQLARFRANPANAGKVMRSGLWYYTRHPNYFGDACVWWGLFFVAADTGPVGLWSLPGPLLITFLLTRVSGMPTVENHLRKSRLDYDDYVSRTSAFIPWPPKAARA